MILMRDAEVNWAAMPLSGVFETADDPLVMIGAFKANPLRDICAALELPDLSLDARFANLEQQFANKPELQRQLRERFKTNTREHWLKRLEEQDLLCAPVRDMREVLVDPQTLHNQMILKGSAARAGGLSLHRQPDRDVGGAGDDAPRAAEARRAHRRGAGRSSGEWRGRGHDRALRSGRPRGHGHDRAARGDERDRPRHRGRAAAHLERARAAPRRARDRAHRRRRARVLRRRRHEEPVGISDAEGRRLLGRGAARRLRRHRAARRRSTSR